MSAVVEFTGSERDADALWSELRNALANFDRVLKRIIETRAWEPLGYDTFAQAWADRMRGMRLGTASMAAQVVYALIESGLDQKGALEVLGPSSGVGPAKFELLARQHEAGVPAEVATTHRQRPVESIPPIAPERGLSVVRQHYRESPSEPHVVHVELTPTEYAHFKAVADRRGLDFARESARALRSHFLSLEGI